MAIATAPQSLTVQPDIRRLTEDDPDYVRLHATTVQRLEASIATFVRELHAARGNTQQEGEAASRFVERHTGELRRAYEAAHTEGVRDYYGAVSASAASKRMPYVAPDADREHQLLAFYVPSVVRMAAEALRTLHESRREVLVEPNDGGAIRLGFPDQPRQKGGRYGPSGWTRQSEHEAGNLRGIHEHVAAARHGESGSGGGAGGRRESAAREAQGRAHADAMHQGAVSARGGRGAAGRATLAERMARLQSEHEAAKTEHAATADRLATAQERLRDARSYRFDVTTAHGTLVRQRDALAVRVGNRTRGRDARDLAVLNRHVSEYRTTLDQAHNEFRDAEANYHAAQAAHTQSGRRVNAARDALARASGARSIDEHGQRTPFTMTEFERAYASARPIGGPANRGEVRGINDARVANINGKEYIVKATSPGMEASYRMGTGHSVTKEVAARAIANAAGMGDHVAAESYHLTDAQGNHYSVQSREPGKTFDAMNANEKTAFEGALKGDMRNTLFEYTIGASDRHSGNILYDPASGKITHVDFGFEFGHSVLYNEFSFTNGMVMRGGSQRAGQVAIPHEAIRALSDHAGRIESAAQHYGLTSAERDGVHARLEVLKQLGQEARPTLADLQRLSQVAHNAQTAPAAAPRGFGATAASARASLAGGHAAANQRRRGFLGRLLGRGR